MDIEERIREAQRAVTRGELTPEEFAERLGEIETEANRAEEETTAESDATTTSSSDRGPDADDGTQEQSVSDWTIESVERPDDIGPTQERIELTVTVVPEAAASETATVGAGEATTTVERGGPTTAALTVEAPKPGGERTYDVFVETPTGREERSVTVANDGIAPDDLIGERITADLLGLAARWSREGRISDERREAFEAAYGTGEPLSPDEGRNSDDLS